MPGEIKEGNLIVIVEKLADGFAQLVTRDNVTRPCHQARAEIHRTVGIAVEHRFHGVSVVHAAMQAGNMLVRINTYNKRLAHSRASGLTSCL
ncbi:hypothetical protein AJ87_07465 [Rhizobium yanglingense]|nr:hypothetical protein AJ87_07465 [Rhizobium yanglingense]